MNSIFKTNVLMFALFIMVTVISCGKENTWIEQDQLPKTSATNVEGQDVSTLKAYYGKLQKVSVDSVLYNEESDNFSIIGRNRKQSRAELTSAYQQSLSITIGCKPFYVPYSPGYCGYPAKWYSDFVEKKMQPYEIIDLEYYKNSIVFGEVSFPFEKKSPNGRFSLIGQDDGNLYIKDNSNGKVLWDAGSYKKYGRSAAYKMAYQADGNLVIYGRPWSGGAENAVFSTPNLYVPNTDYWYFPNIAKNTFYVLQDDGNFVLYYIISSQMTSEMVFAVQPIAETRTWGGRISNQWNQIK
ncbi:MAG: hypothetical protein K0R59_2066 [Sphingobacterium sp.]|jgi:hypothetical protein|nr:hypothetical protein [Sphingobacterium sp.]